MAKPGMVNLPAFFTADPFNSVAVASSATIADFDIATTPFIAVAFIAPAFARGAIDVKGRLRTTIWRP